MAVWNPAAERMFGWSAAEVLGLEPPIIPRELRAEHNAVLERVAAGGQVTLATRRMSKSGEMLDLRLDMASLTDACRRAARLDRARSPERRGRRGPPLHGRAGPGGAQAR